MPPAERKTGGDDQATASRSKRRKGQRAFSLMQSFLQDQLGETAMADDPAFVEAMTLCHERFVRVVAAKLASSAAAATTPSGAAAGGGVQRVGASHVEIAMRELGMEDLLREARAAIAASNKGSRKSGKQPRKATRKRKNRAREFTDEEIAEQERLLASSKSKLLGRG